MNADKLKQHAEKFLKKVYDEQVEMFRRKMYDLMMNDEPLVEEIPFEYADQSEEIGDEIDIDKMSIDTEMYLNQ